MKIELTQETASGRWKAEVLNGWSVEYTAAGYDREKVLLRALAYAGVEVVTLELAWSGNNLSMQHIHSSNMEKF